MYNFKSKIDNKKYLIKIVNIKYNKEIYIFYENKFIDFTIINNLICWDFNSWELPRDVQNYCNKIVKLLVFS